MPLITRCWRVWLLLNCLCVVFITFGSVSSKWESKTIRNPVISCQSWVKSYILNRQGLRFKMQMAISEWQKQIYCRIRIGVCLPWLRPKSFAKRTQVFKPWKEPLCLLSPSASASRSVSILSTLSCTSIAIFHSFAAVSRIKVLQCHSPTIQVNSLLYSERKVMLLTLRMQRVDTVHAV